MLADPGDGAPSDAEAPLVLVVGDVIDDLIVKPLGPVHHASDTRARISSVPGGSGANQATWLAAAGARVRFAGRVGVVDVERHQRVLREAGVDARLAADPSNPTGRIVVLVDLDGERTMFTDRGANLALSVDDLPDELLDGVAGLHLSGYSLFEPGVREAVLDLVARARERNLPFSVDPSSAAFLAEVGPARFLAWIEGVGMLFPNLDEGRILTGIDEPREVLRKLLDHAPLVALKLGASGALIATREGPVLEVEALPVDVVDTTGAGDAFCAGFLAALLAGAELAAAGTRAVEAGARAVTVTGARPDPGWSPPPGRLGPPSAE